MSATIAQIKDHLTGMSGAASVDDVVGLYALMERSANTMLARLDPLETEREQALAQTVHDDLQNYVLPSDYKKIIYLMPQEALSLSDRAFRDYMERFAAEVNFQNKRITIESKEGTKFIRINWKSASAKTLHAMNSLTEDGTIAAVGSAAGLKANELYKLSGNASIEFDLVASGDGISVLNKTNDVDLEDWDEMADFIVPVYLGDVSKFTSISFIFGNDLTTKLWTAVAQTTQSDGTAVKAGWNYFLFPWVGATESGVVDPATIDSFKLTIVATGVISNIRVDNILVSLGRFFNLKYYSQYAFRNSAGTWIVRPTQDTDSVVYSGTALQIYILESRIAIAQQLIKDPKMALVATTWERVQLNGDPTASDSSARMGLYGKYRAEHPSESKKQIGSYWSPPSFHR